MKWIAMGLSLLGMAAATGGALRIVFDKEALIYPIQLHQGFFLHQQVRVSSNAVYRIELRCSRALSFDRLTKFLETGHLAEISLLRDGQPSEIHYFPVTPMEPVSLGFSSQWISQNIGTFVANRKSKYTIDARVIREVPELQMTRPILVVALDPLEIEGRAFAVLLLLLISLVLGLLAVGVWWWEKKNRRKGGSRGGGIGARIRVSII